LLGTTGCMLDTNSNDPDPCDPNPCTQSGKTTCASENGKAVCLCAPGTVPRPSGVCETVSAANCAEHPGDTSEPDDCLSRAAALTADGRQRQQSIDPIGDYDFFKLDGLARELYSVTVEPGGSLMPRVDVFDQQGVWQGSQDGRPKAQLIFKARATAPYYVRMSHSPYDASAATGPYALTLSSLGQDDYGDNSTEATSLTPTIVDSSGSTVPYRNGNIQYSEDEDWIAIAATQGTTYRIEFEPNRLIPAVAAFTREDTKQPFLTIRNSWVELKAATTTTLYVDFYSPTGAETGAFGFRVLSFR
ncbi:MAG TPA: hypothetical protein VF794_27055, partial [Archangium sp.]|uniref:hypothetical protein n=1 Tax=Archangium sp. TaxID=1872627 RepID=UPI002ED893B2